MTISNDWSLHLVRKSGAEPEQQIAASLIVAARESCASGNRDDCQWLHVCALGYLSLICPEHVNEQDILKRLLADLPVADELREGCLESSVQFIQVCIELAGGFTEHPLMNTAWGKHLMQRPATRPREPTPAARQPLLSGLED